MLSGDAGYVLDSPFKAVPAGYGYLRYAAGSSVLDEAELLPTIAEISVAFAGFASLVSVFGARSSGAHLAPNLIRLRGMIETALLVLAFSLVPYLPYKFGMSSEASWRVAAVVFALAALARVFLVGTRMLATSPNRWFLGFGAAQGLAALLLLAAAPAFSLATVVGAYHLLLYLYLLTAAFLFLRAALRVFETKEPAA